MENKTKYAGFKIKNKHFSNTMKDAKKGLNNSHIKINENVESPLINPTLESSICSSQVNPKVGLMLFAVVFWKIIPPVLKKLFLSSAVLLQPPVQ